MHDQPTPGFQSVDRSLYGVYRNVKDLRDGGLGRIAPARFVVKVSVGSPDKSRFIAIPEDVEGYGNLRSELAKYGEIDEVPKGPASIVAYVPTLLCRFSWALVLFSKEVSVVRTAAAFALFSSAWYSFRVGQLVRRSPKRHLIWLVLASSWLGALWVVYQRIFRT